MLKKILEKNTIDNFLTVVVCSVLYLQKGLWGPADSAIMELVDEFGRKLQNVPLQAPREVLEELMRENYSKYVVPELLSK